MAQYIGLTIYMYFKNLLFESFETYDMLASFAQFRTCNCCKLHVHVVWFLLFYWLAVFIFLNILLSLLNTVLSDSEGLHMFMQPLKSVTGIVHGRQWVIIEGKSLLSDQFKYSQC